MRTNLLLMCKLMFLLLVFNGFYGYISDPFLPFIPFLDVFNNYPGIFKWSLKVLFLIGGVGLLFNVRVRQMAIILGGSIIVMLLASKPLFRNHLFICGCVFMLCGLSNKDQDPWLLYYQLSLVYFGAVMNKVVQLDWWNGQFMHNWLLISRENIYYKNLYELLPGKSLAKLFSWSSMLIELSISIMLLSKKRHKTAVWTILVFHTTLFTFTGFRFGHFFEDIVIYLLAFSFWPSGIIEVSINREKTFISPGLLTLLNWNNQFIINNKELSAPNWLYFQFSGREYFNYKAFGSLILYTPATYFLLLFFDSGIQLLFNEVLDYPYNKYAMYAMTSILLWGGIIFYACINLKSNNLSSVQSRTD